MTRLLAALLLALATSAAAGFAQVAKPRVPPHKDPGGVAVALMGPGIDYTLPHLAERLARDGEGEIIGWDLLDNDPRPYDASKGQSPAGDGGDATALASLLVADTGLLKLVVLRVDAKAPASLANAVAFVARTPTRIAVVPLWGQDAKAWEPFRQAALRFKHILFIAAAGEGADPGALYPAALGLENVLVLSAGPGSADAKGFGGHIAKVGGGPLAATIAARAAAKILVREPHIELGRLKQGILEGAAKP